MYYEDPAQPLTTAGEDLDNIDDDLSDLSDLSDLCEVCKVTAAPPENDS